MAAAQQQLSCTVTVHDADGAPHAFGPGDDVPKWAREAITNPDVWADPDSDDGPEPDIVAQSQPVESESAAEAPKRGSRGGRRPGGSG